MVDGKRDCFEMGRRWFGQRGFGLVFKSGLFIIPIVVGGDNLRRDTNPRLIRLTTARGYFGMGACGAILAPSGSGPKALPANPFDLRSIH